MFLIKKHIFLGVSFRPWLSSIAFYNRFCPCLLLFWHLILWILRLSVVSSQLVRITTNYWMAISVRGRHVV